MNYCDPGSDSDTDWEGGELEESLESPCLCLFCSKELEGTTAVLEHCHVDHGFHLMELVQKMNLDFYSCIRLLNYIRKEGPEPSTILEATRPFPWEHSTYLSPVLVDDPLLQLDFDPSVDDSNSVPSKNEEGETDLKAKITKLEEEVEQYKEALGRAHLDLEHMRSAVQAIISDDDPPQSPSSTKDSICFDSDGDSYFQSYAHHSIHEEMLKDEVRTETYKIFIEKNSELFKDKVVLDVGCGTGVLSMFAACAGAQRVIGVDQSDIIYKAMDIVRENGMEDKVTLIKGKVEEIELPVDQVDIIISEWMGYFLLFESMLDTVLYARDKWLRDPTKLFPSQCSINLVALGNKFEWESKVQYWNNVYGFKMSCMKEGILREASIEVVDAYSAVSSSDTVIKFDLSKTQVPDLEFEASFEMTLQYDTVCYAIGGYFDVGFEKVPYLVHMSTSPLDEPTHWKQTVFYLEKPFQVHTGDLLKGTVQCCKVKGEPRSLEVTISYELISFLPDSEQVKCKRVYYLR